MIHLLDTNVFMHLANEAPGHRNIERHIELAGAASLRASAITLAELRTKVLRGNGRVKRIHLAKLAAIVSKLVVEDFTVLAAEHAASIMALLEATGRRNTWPDVLIAGHAASAGYRLVTDDAALLRTPGLDAVNWRLSAME